MSTISGISFSGLASGLDTKSLVQQLVALEGRPIAAFRLRKTTLATQKTLFTQLETKLNTLKSAADALGTTSKLLDFKASSDETGFFTTAASSGATTGNFTIAVSALAKAEVSNSLGKADKDTTTYGSGTLQVTINGVPKDIVIDDTNNTLAGIAGAINAGDAGVTATVVDTGSASNPFRIVIQGKSTGTANSFSLSTTGGSAAGLTSLASEINTNVVTAAGNASLTVNGVGVTRASNVISDVISGVTLTLTGVHSVANPDSNLSVSSDTTKVSEKVKKLVDSYNDLLSFVNAQGVVDATGKTSSTVFGDATFASVRSALRANLGGSVDTGSTSYQLLSQVGITSDKTGALTFDAAKFETALLGGEAFVAKLFTQSGTGIAQSVSATIKNYTDSTTGFLKARKDGIDQRQKDLDAQIVRGESRLTSFEATLTAKYARLEELMSKLQSQGSALSSVLGSLR